MSEEPKQRLVKCVKLGRELPGLEKPPRNDELGKRIFENVSEQGWQLWLSQQTLLINHYGLNMVDPQAREFLAKQMEEFFFGDGAQLPEDWIPEEERGQHPTPGEKGAPATKGADPSKGSPAPAQK
jgi:Fe-S cluster biosynthesis and repair protein YggX